MPRQRAGPWLSKWAPVLLSLVRLVRDESTSFRLRNHIGTVPGLLSAGSVGPVKLISSQSFLDCKATQRVDNHERGNEIVSNQSKKDQATGGTKSTVLSCRGIYYGFPFTRHLDFTMVLTDNVWVQAKRRSMLTHVLKDTPICLSHMHCSLSQHDGQPSASIPINESATKCCLLFNHRPAMYFNATIYNTSEWCQSVTQRTSSEESHLN